MTPLQIKNAVANLVQRRDSANQIFEDIERYICPYRGRFYEPQKSEHEFDWFRPYRMDDTAVLASDRLSSTLHAKLTPFAFQWFNLKFRDDEFNANKQFTKWLEDCGRRMAAQLTQSRFDSAIGEFYQDFTSYHTAYFGRELPSYRDWEGVDFKALPLRECYSELDHNGMVNRFYRYRQMTLLQIVNQFGEDNLPQRLRDLWEMQEKSAGNTSKDQKFPVIFAVWRRGDNPTLSDAVTDGTPPENRPYGYRYVMGDTADPIGEEGGYYSMPVYRVVYKKSVGSDYGHGPSMIVMSNIKTLNRLVYLHMKQLEKQINPPTLSTEDNLVTDLDLTDGGLTIVENLDNIRPYLDGGRLEVSDARIRQMQSDIEDAFHIRDIELKESPAMTATEVAARQRKSQEMMASPVGNIQNSLLKPVLEDLFNDMFRMGQFADMPPGLEDADLEISYLGSAALAQRSDIASGIERTVGTAAGLQEVFPEIMDGFDPDEIAKELGGLNGAPAKIYRDEGEVAAIRKQRNEQQQQAAQAATAKDQAQAAKDQAQAVNAVAPGQGAGLAQVLGGMGG